MDLDSKIDSPSILTYHGFDPVKTSMRFLIPLQAILLGILVWAAGLFFIPYFPVEPYEYPKALFFIIVVGLLTIVNFVHFFSFDGQFSFRKLPLEIKVLFCVVVAECLAFLFSTNHLHSLLGAPYRFQGLIAQAAIVIYFLNVVYIFRLLPPASRKLFFQWVIGAAFASALLSLSPFIFENSFFYLAAFKNRVYGALGNPNYLAVYLAAIVPFLGLFLVSKSRMTRFVIFTGGLFLLFVLFLTGSRSSWVSLFFGLFIISILAAWKKRTFQILIIALSIFSLIAGIFLFQRSYETQLFHRFSLTQDNVGSVMTRLHLQKAGFRLFLERPIFGTGQEMITDHIEPYLPEYLQTNRVFYIDRTHNEFLDVLVTQGLVGFFTYMIFWITLFWIATKHYLRSEVLHQSSFDASLFLFSISAILIIHTYYFMNFSVISANILLYLFAGYVVAARYQKRLLS